MLHSKFLRSQLPKSGLFPVPALLLWSILSSVANKNKVTTANKQLLVLQQWNLAAFHILIFKTAGCHIAVILGSLLHFKYKIGNQIKLSNVKVRLWQDACYRHSKANGFNFQCWQPAWLRLFKKPLFVLSALL